jgi:hypothetical protein
LALTDRIGLDERQRPIAALLDEFVNRIAALLLFGDYHDALRSSLKKPSR